jgi:hypothetical protein
MWPDNVLPALPSRSPHRQALEHEWALGSRFQRLLRDSMFHALELHDMIVDCTWEIRETSDTRVTPANLGAPSHPGNRMLVA